MGIPPGTVSADKIPFCPQITLFQGPWIPTITATGFGRLITTTF